MDAQSLRVLVGALAQQQYFFHVLTKMLVEKKILEAGEISSRYSERDMHALSHDLLDHLIATGLKMDENLPSSSLKESPVSAQSEAKEVAGPELDKKS